MPGNNRSSPATSRMMPRMQLRATTGENHERLSNRLFMVTSFQGAALFPVCASLLGTCKRNLAPTPHRNHVLTCATTGRHSHDLRFTAMKCAPRRGRILLSKRNLSAGCSCEVVMSSTKPDPQEKFLHTSETESICLSCHSTVRGDRYEALKVAEDVHAVVCLMRDGSPVPYALE